MQQASHPIRLNAKSPPNFSPSAPETSPEQLVGKEGATHGPDNDQAASQPKAKVLSIGISAPPKEQHQKRKENEQENKSSVSPTVTYLC